MLKYYQKEVLYNENVKYGVGIITGWQEPKKVFNNLKEETKEKVVTCGTLYSINGINYIIANLYLNPHITELILLENPKMSEVAQAGLKTFLNYIMTSKPEFHKKFKFREEQLDNFASYYKNHIKIVKVQELDDVIQNMEIPEQDWCNITEIEEEEINLQSQIPSEKMGFQVQANTVYQAWRRALKLIQTYGYLKQSDHGENQLELMNLSIVVREEDKENPSIDGIQGITKQQLEEYENEIISNIHQEGVHYTYGERFRNSQGTDQLEYIITELKDRAYSRRAVACLWIPELDSKTGENPPCINLYQAIIQGEYLYLTTYFRANDIYEAWPRNIYGILKIQDVLCKELGYKRGYVNTIAGSAHVYERNFKNLEEEVQNQPVSFCEEDQRGYFTVTVEDNKIKVTFYNKKGEELRIFSGQTATELRDKCTFYISNMDHAFYLGQELQKAEIALKEELAYTQDQPISFQKVKQKKLEV